MSEPIYDILKVKDNLGIWHVIPALKGNRGNGIASLQFSLDGTLTITDDDGEVTTYTGITSALTAIGAKEQEITAAELSRVLAEQTRAGAEEARQNSETIRRNAETVRNADETLRRNAESARDAAELLRSSAESTRQENEATRQSNENSRQDAEAARAAAETERVTAETARQTAETARAIAEEDRETLYDQVSGMTADAETLAPGSSATATKQTDAQGNINFHFGIPRGTPGDVPAASIAPVEATATASKAYAAGDYFWRSGILYAATEAIAAGGTITLGTNCKEAVIGEDLDQLKNAFNASTGNEVISFINGKYIQDNYSAGSVVDYENPITGAVTNNCAVVDAAEGDVFTVNGTGGRSGRLWCFVDSMGQLITVSGENAIGNNLLITAPENAYKLILNIVGEIGFNCRNAIIRNVVNKSDASTRMGAVALPFSKAENGMVDATDGKTYASSAQAYTNYINIEGYGSIKFKRVGSTAATGTAGIAFYSDIGVNYYIAGYGMMLHQAETGYLPELCEVIVPDGAKYVRCSMFKNTGTYGEFEIYGVSNIVSTTNKNSKTTAYESIGYNVINGYPASGSITSGSTYRTIYFPCIAGYTYHISRTLFGGRFRPYYTSNEDPRTDLHALPYADGNYYYDITAEAGWKYILMYCVGSSSEYAAEEVVDGISVTMLTATDYTARRASLATVEIAENVLRRINEPTILELHETDKQRAAPFRIQRTSSEQYGQAKLRLLFFTDVHNETDRVKRAVTLLNGWGSSFFDVAINAGDTTATLYNADQLAAYDAEIEKSTIPVLNTVGNHDVYETLGIPLADSTIVYQAITAKVKENVPNIVQPANAETNGLNYYYYDVNQIRIVVLDCMYWNSDELSWFEAVLADAMTNEKAVIAVSHYNFVSTEVEYVDSIWNPKSYGVGGSSSYPMPIAAARAVKDFQDDGGEFIIWLCGHSHGDAIKKLKEEYGSQFQLICPAFVNRGSTVIKPSDQYAYNHDCLTYIVVDTYYKNVKGMRIGANINVEGAEYHTFSINYGTGIFLGSC